MDGRAQFTFYRSYYDALKNLPKKEQTAVILAICAYALDNEEPKLQGTASAIFTLIRPTLDAGRRKAMGGKNGTPKKDKGKIEERYDEDVEKEIEKEKEKEIEKEVEIEVEEKKEKKPDEPDAFEQFAAGDDRLLDSLKGFEEMRKKQKNPLTDRAKKILITSLKKLSENPDVQIQIIDQSTANGWKGFYELKSSTKTGGDGWDMILKEAGRR